MTMKDIKERTPVEGKENILSVFEELGFGKVDFGACFESEYQDFHWVLMPHPIAKVRLYAIPDKERMMTCPWDSWYFINGEPIHHVHYAKQLDSTWQRWLQPSSVPECPEELVGIPWFWYNESRVTPSILIKQIREEKL